MVPSPHRVSLMPIPHQEITAALQTRTQPCPEILRQCIACQSRSVSAHTHAEITHTVRAVEGVDALQQLLDTRIAADERREGKVEIAKG
jgi:hypothetical protein